MTKKPCRWALMLHRLILQIDVGPWPLKMDGPRANLRCRKEVPFPFFLEEICPSEKSDRNMFWSVFLITHRRFKSGKWLLFFYRMAGENLRKKGRCDPTHSRHTLSRLGNARCRPRPAWSIGVFRDGNSMQGEICCSCSFVQLFRKCLSLSSAFGNNID